MTTPPDVRGTISPTIDLTVDEQLPDDSFGYDVEMELYRLKVRDRAQEMHRAAKAGPVPAFDAGTLSEVLARPAQPPSRVEGLIPADASTEIVAQRKTGKTTLMLNLARSLLTGEDFLGRFAVRPLEGRVAFLNYEVSAGQLARWAADAGVPADRMYLVNVRGRRNPLAVDDDRERLAEHLRHQEIEAVIVDPFGRAYSGKSQNDPGEVGAWLADLDRWARGDVGAFDVILAAHAGWDGERTRGASALEDWADSVITLVRDKDDESIRYLRAFGRDVEVEEDRLTFDPSTRSLRMSGSGNRKVSARRQRVAKLMPAVVEAVKADPGVSGTRLRSTLREAGHEYTKGDEIAAAQMAVEAGQIRTEHGPRNATLHYPINDPPAPSRTLPTGTSLTLPSLPYRTGGSEGKVKALDPPGNPEPESALSACGHPANIRALNGKCALCLAEAANRSLREHTGDGCPNCGAEVWPDGLCVICESGGPDAA